MSISLTGLAALQRGMAAAGQRYANASGGALYLEATRIMNKSTKLVPVDTGRLRASQFVAAPKLEVSGLTVRMGYGTDYAVPVHERQEINHPVGGAKFLRRAFDEARSSTAKNIALDTQRLFRDGKGFGDVMHPFPTRPKK